MGEWKIKRPLLLLFAVIVLGELAVIKWGRMDVVDLLPPPGTGITGNVQRIEETEYGWQVLLSCRQNNKILVSFGEFPPVTIGTTLYVKGKWQEFSPATNPGQFDAASYYHAQNIRYRLKASEYRVLKVPRFSYRQKLADFRTMLEERLLEFAFEEDAKTLSALLLGDKKAIASEVKELYQEAGIAHILAVSGLHISLVGMTLFTLLRKMGTPYSVCAGISGFFVVSFCILSGEGISAFRATMMYVAFVTAKVIGRCYDMASAMALAGILILLQTPGQITQAGFLLSFGAVFALSLICPHYQNPEDKKWKNTLRTMIVLQLMLLPLTLYFFYQYPLYSILLNLVVVPLLTPVFLCSVAGLLFGRLFFLPVHGILWMYCALAQSSLLLPGSILSPGKPSLVRIGFYYTGYFAAAWLKKKKQSKMVYVLLVCCLLVLFCPQSSRQLMISVLDVGQGDAILLELPGGGNMLIDGGSSDVKEVGTYRLLPCLQSKGIHHLQAAVLTHPDSDHLNGMLEIIESGKVRIDCLLLPEADGLKEDWKEVLLAAKEQNITVKWVKQGDVLRFQKISLTCLNPDSGDYRDKSNEASLVFWLQYGDFDMLFTGDVEGAAEKNICAAIQEYGLNHRSLEVLKVAHHGSDSSTSKELLALVRPSAAVLSYGEGNSYGHPHKDVMEKLHTEGCRIYETARIGAVIIRTKGEKFDISGYLGRP